MTNECLKEVLVAPAPPQKTITRSILERRLREMKEQSEREEERQIESIRRRLRLSQ